MQVCGGALEVSGNQTTVTCEYCGTQQMLPRLDDDRRANLYDRANHFRRNNEFDKAMGIYEKILNEDNSDAEAYWSLVLCRYGIEYVEDPATHRWVPTVNRTQFTSIFDDEDYNSALRCADGAQRRLYEQEAQAINEIQKGILAISQQEEPFDVFICYKETDQNGRRTPDSVLATELYHELKEESFKVFFSRITLEDKLGTAYKPYIFAALNSARVMVVLVTKPEYFNAVWVKNEWSRYLALIKNGAKKVLIPAYRDMDPYDLPEELSHLQAQDMSKLGFMQDLIRGIKKLTEGSAPKAAPVQTAPQPAGGGNVAVMLKRAFLALGDGDFDQAYGFCDQVLNHNPECAQAYIGKMMASMSCKDEADIYKLFSRIDDNPYYQRALQFADDNYKQILLGYNAAVFKNIFQKLLTEKESLLRRAEQQSEHVSSLQWQSLVHQFAEIESFVSEAVTEVEECKKHLEAALSYEKTLAKIKTKIGKMTLVFVFGSIVFFFAGASTHSVSGIKLLLYLGIAFFSTWFIVFFVSCLLPSHKLKSKK